MQSPKPRELAGLIRLLKAAQSGTVDSADLANMEVTSDDLTETLKKFARPVHSSDKRIGIMPEQPSYPFGLQAAEKARKALLIATDLSIAIKSRTWEAALNGAKRIDELMA